MNIVVVSYSWLPHVSPRSLRWSAIVSSWVSLGHKVEVVCGSMGESAGTTEETGVIIHRVAGLLGNLSERNRRREENSHLAVTALSRRGGRMRAVAKWVHMRTWRRIYWPDYACDWIPGARRLLKERLRERDVDALVTVSPPFSGHVVVPRGLCRQLGIRWLVDLGDPFSFCDVGAFNNRLLYSKLNHWAERRIFSAADCISVTTQGTSDIYTQLYPDLGKRIHVIPPLLQDSAVAPMFHASPAATDARRQLLYVGSFYPEVREPEPIFELVKALVAYGIPKDRLPTIHIYGEAGIYESELRNFAEVHNSLLVLHGRVSHESCIGAMYSADVLVNIGNRTSYQLPSKIVEYMATGKSILNLAVVENDSSSRFLEGYPLGLTVGPKLEARRLKEVIDFIIDSRNVHVDAAEVAALVGPHLVSTISGTYLDLLRQP